MKRENRNYIVEIPVFKKTIKSKKCDKLRAEILNKYEKTEGVQGSNRKGGWQSRHNLHEWDIPGVDILLHGIHDLVCEAVEATVEEPFESHFEDWRLHAWANVNEKGAYNESHDHYSWSNLPLWSGIYYVDPGRSSDGGSIGGQTVFELEDPIGIPRPEQSDGDSFVQEVTIEPQPGLMVLFPSTLRHRVEPYLGDSRRITIAWNLFHPHFQIPDADGEGADSVQHSQTLWHAKQVLSAVSGAIRNPSILLRKLGVLENGTSRDDEAIEEYLRDVSKLNP